jgi:hypothetical protein
MRRQALPLPLTWLHHVEFRNASLNALLTDAAGGVFAGAAPPLAEILTEAERLSALHTEKLGTRSLD